ncbi:tRNA uridine-5-carboxymethylaminomethyl(34) synthesis GTPase MnmE [Mycoplasma corogypsi]|uniref:tRNA uridine-5-carboxymethylaminomethyl(34) synthesis GTPase MnmE n=1 Tax=Mycoplasma corogypsi TaxID=2106 RepID=UPI0038730731
MNDNIAVISSGSRINQAISIVRICGPDAVEIVKKIFKGKVGNNLEMTFGQIHDNGLLIDKVYAKWLIGKEVDGKMVYNNYVGEPTVEIDCHGGIVVTNKILELLLANGARLAEPGEFTRRAFLNGKLDLIEADAIHDLIMAKTLKQATASVNRFHGKTSVLVENLLHRISLLIGTCEVNIDYPEYDDIEQLDTHIMIEKLNELLAELTKIIKVSEDSRYIFEGVNVAILGKPNVGKSSILNALLSEEKAIVTDIAGTTRDVIEASYQIDGMLFKLIDTAGLRKTEEKIEQIGIKKSLEQIDKADLVIHVIDPTQQENEFDLEIEQKVKQQGKFYIRVLNKKDLITDIKNENVVISALNKDIKELEQALVANFKDIDIMDERIFNNTRQLSLIKNAYISLEDAKVALENNYTYDVVIIDLYKAWDSLQMIKGNVNREDLLDIMFGNFCLGK